VPWNAAFGPGATLYTSAGCFTPRYAPPEAFIGKTSRSFDQYSLALTFCELVYGRLPFSDGEDQEEKRRRGEMDLEFLPPVTRPILAKALSPQPQDRFPSCTEFWKALSEGYSRLGTAAAGTSPQGRRDSDRSPAGSRDDNADDPPHREDDPAGPRGIALAEPKGPSLHDLLQRLRTGDRSARDELVSHTYNRLHRLARRMLRGCPEVGRWEQTDDILHNALARLLRALETTPPDSVRHFYNLAAHQIRRELLDLVDRLQGPRGVGGNPTPPAAGAQAEALDRAKGPLSLAVWWEFHKAVESLPDELREVIGLVYYDGLTKDEAAEVLGVLPRTVKRRWNRACSALSLALGWTSPQGRRDSDRSPADSRDDNADDPPRWEDDSAGPGGIALADPKESSHKEPGRRHSANRGRETVAPGGACLVHIYPSGPSLGCRYDLANKPLILGRGDDCKIRMLDHSVSRKHAKIEPAPEGYYVQDLQSTNGTFVNDRQIDGPSLLQDGDYLRVGNCIYRCLAGGNIEAEYHEEIHRLTILDGLTQIHNQRYLSEFLDREVARSRWHARPLSLLMFDIDRFKTINDSFGHLCGDFVLRELVAVVRPLARPGDLLARYGGEEFVLALVETPLEEAATVAERLRQAVADHKFRFKTTPVRLTVSIGVATLGLADATAIQLLRNADEAVYRAKIGGRNRVCT
jgi:RNA polymerase sigma factor (sigma-70 family)